MSEIKVANASAVFPSGTTVKAYAQKGPQPITPQSGPPAGASVAEAEVQANGELTITGLAEKTFYLFSAEVAGAYRYLHVYCEAAGETVVIATQATGDFAVTTAGKGYRVKEGANAKMGTATLVAGKVTVANTSVTATSRVFLQAKGAKGAHIGGLTVTAKVAATSFTVESAEAEDVREFDYIIFEPA